jgi:hypothetical protein
VAAAEAAELVLQVEMHQVLGLEEAVEQVEPLL